MAGDTHSVTDQKTIASSFPPLCQRIAGQPSLLDLLDIYRHLVKCAGSHTSRYDPLNLTYIATPEGLWRMYTTRNYPEAPVDPGDQPIYNPDGLPVENAARKDDWLLRRKYYAEDQNMNRALIERFLSLLDETITTTFRENALLTNPKMRFQFAFDYFFGIYGRPNERLDRENRVRMEAKWKPLQGIDALIAQIEHGVTFAFFTNNPFTDKQLANAFMLQIGNAGCYGAWLKD